MHGDLHIPKKAYPVRWIPDAGWVLEVPAAVGARELEAAKTYALAQWKRYYGSMQRGDKKDELKRLIEVLQRDGLQQRVVGARGDGKGDIELYLGRKDL